MDNERTGQPSPRQRPPRYKRAVFWVQLGLVAGIVLGAWLSLRTSVAEPETRAPSHIGDMRRTGLVTGEEAIKQTQSMHIGDIGIKDGYVADYQAGTEKLTLWVGVAGSQSDAQRLLERMASAIGAGGTPFARPTQVAAGGRQVFVTSGAGGVNYFFQEARSVVWVLAVNSAAPEDRLSAVLENVRFE